MEYKNKLKKLLLMCIKKGLTMYINSKCESISIYNIDENCIYTFDYNSYYTGDLSDINNGNIVKLEELIEKVKNYKP